MSHDDRVEDLGEHEYSQRITLEEAYHALYLPVTEHELGSYTLGGGHPVGNFLEVLQDFLEGFLTVSQNKGVN